MFLIYWWINQILLMVASCPSQQSGGLCTSRFLQVGSPSQLDEGKKTTGQLQAAYFNSMNDGLHTGSNYTTTPCPRFELYVMMLFTRLFNCTVVISNPLLPAAVAAGGSSLVRRPQISRPKSRGPTPRRKGHVRAFAGPCCARSKPQNGNMNNIINTTTISTSKTSTYVSFLVRIRGSLGLSAGTYLCNCRGRMTSFS